VDTSKELKSDRPLNVISFCSGYGGIERGLDLAGTNHRVLAYVEIEAYAIASLVNKMESGELDAAPIYTDLKTFPAHLFRDCVDLLTAGYPCQPFSASGNRKGEDDPRHLWPYIREHINAIRPTQCFFENVEGHISLGLSSVLSDLEEDGYSTTWSIFSASECRAPHQRKRVFILANTRRSSGSEGVEPSQLWATGTSQPSRSTRQESGSATYAEGQAWPIGAGENQHSWEEPRTVWKTKPELGGTIDGFADRVDRIRLLGNGVVPQTAAKAWEVLNAR